VRFTRGQPAQQGSKPFLLRPCSSGPGGTGHSAEVASERTALIPAYGTRPEGCLEYTALGVAGQLKRAGR
jgi:hypothetical protein